MWCRSLAICKPMNMFLSWTKRSANSVCLEQKIHWCSSFLFYSFIFYVWLQNKREKKLSMWQWSKTLNPDIHLATKPNSLKISPNLHQLHNQIDQTPVAGQQSEQGNGKLTIAAVWASIGRHATVAWEALPLLQTHPLIMARVLRAGGAGSFTYKNTHWYISNQPMWIQINTINMCL